MNQLLHILLRLLPAKYLLFTGGMPGLLSFRHKVLGQSCDPGEDPSPEPSNRLSLELNLDGGVYAFQLCLRVLTRIYS